MTGKKLDGVVEAVRYTASGKIALVRAYERHGVVWSDHILLDRNELAERLKRGKRFVVGERTIYLGSVFNAGMDIRQVGDHIVTEGQTGGHDKLIGVPVF